MGVFNVNIFFMDPTVGPPSCLRVGYCLNRDADCLNLGASDLTESCL